LNTALKGSGFPARIHDIILTDDLRDSNLISGMSSPLTSLSSLDDADERLLPEFPDSSCEREDLKAAQASPFPVVDDPCTHVKTVIV